MGALLRSMRQFFVQPQYDDYESMAVCCGAVWV